MRKLDHLQTMALTYQEIVQGERPWTALGNFIFEEYRRLFPRTPSATTSIASS